MSGQHRYVPGPRGGHHYCYRMQGAYPCGRPESNSIHTGRIDGRVDRLIAAAEARGARKVREAVEAALERVVRFDGSCEYVTADSVWDALDAAAPTGDQP